MKKNQFKQLQNVLPGGGEVKDPLDELDAE